MGRPRKRRREDVQPEEAPEGQPEPNSIIDAFIMPTFGDSGLIPNTDLTADLSGFQDVPVNNTFSNSIMPPTYVESFGPVPTYETR